MKILRVKANAGHGKRPEVRINVAKQATDGRIMHDRFIYSMEMAQAIFAGLKELEKRGELSNE